jgi:hypothetical protein
MLVKHTKIRASKIKGKNIKKTLVKRSGKSKKQTQHNSVTKRRRTHKRIRFNEKGGIFGVDVRKGLGLKTDLTDLPKDVKKKIEQNYGMQDGRYVNIPEGDPLLVQLNNSTSVIKKLAPTKEMIEKGIQPDGTLNSEKYPTQVTGLKQAILTAIAAKNKNDDVTFVPGTKDKLKIGERHRQKTEALNEERHLPFLEHYMPSQAAKDAAKEGIHQGLNKARSFFGMKTT